MYPAERGPDMASYGEKLKKKDYNVPRRMSFEPGKHKRHKRPQVYERRRPADVSLSGPSAGESRTASSAAEPDLSGHRSEGFGSVGSFGKAEKDSASAGKETAEGIADLQFTRSRKRSSTPASRRSARLKASAPVSAVSAKLRHEIDEKSDGNSGVQAANAGTQMAEMGTELIPSQHFGGKLKGEAEVMPGRDGLLEGHNGAGAGRGLKFTDEAEKLKTVEDAARNSVPTASAATTGRTPSGGHNSKKGIGNLQEPASSNPLSRFQQRRKIREQYATAARISAAGTAAGEEVSIGITSLTARLKEAFKGLGESVSSHGHFLLIGGLLALILMAVIGGASSCSLFVGGGGNSVVSVSYTAKDEDILGAEEDYRELEKELLEEMQSIESENPDFDEYNYTLDEIGHNPYQLATILTILYEDYTREEVQEMLKRLFDAQYELTLDPVTEIRTREVERTGTREVLNPETGQTEEETYTYTETEEYEYRILNVTLTNRQLMQVIEELDLGEDRMERFRIMLDLKGNRPYLFNTDIYSNTDADAEGTPENPWLDFRVSGEALTDQEFAAMFSEAKKYLGRPYVWGGSTPESGFDCSGYVCWVINKSGVGKIGRTTAEGLRQWTTPISASERKPGDIVYFQGTYDTPGASHVGIYVGDGTMIHCGNPCKYSNIDSGYFANHMLGYGRIPED